MQIKQIMSRKVTTITKTTTWRAIWKLIFAKKVNALPVVDDEKKLIGIVTREDIMQYLYPNYSEFVEDFLTTSDFDKMEERIKDLVNLKAENIMSQRVLFTHQDTPVMRGLSRMIARRVDQLPVVDDQNRVVGIITKGDIFYYLFKKHLKSS